MRLALRPLTDARGSVSNLSRDRQGAGFAARTLIIIAAFLLAASACAAPATAPRDWVPVRWTGDARMVEPSALELLKDTPFNCLLIEWVGEVRERAFAKAARARGIAVLGLANWGGAAPAPEPDLAGFAIEGNPPAGAIGSSIAIAEAAWPRVRPPSDTAEATPSTEPWIDSNLWLARVLGSRSTGSPVWLAATPDKPAPGDYERAIADAAAAGAQWVVTLDAHFRKALLEGDKAALAQWHRIARVARFYREHPEWRGAAPVSDLVIVRDPKASDKDMTDEYVNLITRRRVPYRLVERGALSSEVLEGAAAALTVELSPPSASERTVLENFARAGGAIVVSSAWIPGEKKSDTYREQPLGRGRVAIYGEAIPDPETVSKDIADIAGAANLTVRLFNAPSVLCHAATTQTALVVQLVNYASRPAEGVTLRVRGRYSKVRLLAPGETARELPADTSGPHMQVRVPSLSVAAAVIFER